MAYRKRRYRRKKTNPNTIILVTAAAIALAISGVMGTSGSRLLTSAVIGLLILAILLAGFLAFLVYHNLTIRHERQQAVTDKNVDRMSWQDFENFVAQLLKTQGYKINSRPSGPKDQGADIIASLGHNKYAIQLKHYHAKLDNTPVQEAVGAKAHYGCNASMVVTNSHFTSGAKLLAASNNCILIDREALGQWILK